MRVLMVFMGYMAMCSHMPRTAPASMCCRRQQFQANAESRYLLGTLLVSGLLVSMTRTETNFGLHAAISWVTGVTYLDCHEF